MKYTDEELLACARRELAYRKKVYGYLLARGRMEPKEAEAEIGKMAAIVEHFEALVEPGLFDDVPDDRKGFDPVRDDPGRFE